jgi:hypothetical protein
MARGKREPAKINANLQKSDAMHALAPYLYVLSFAFSRATVLSVKVVLSYIQCRTDKLVLSLLNSNTACLT